MGSIYKNRYLPKVKTNNRYDEEFTSLPTQNEMNNRFTKKELQMDEKKTSKKNIIELCKWELVIKNANIGQICKKGASYYPDIIQLTDEERISLEDAKRIFYIRGNDILIDTIPGEIEIEKNQIILKEGEYIKYVEKIKSNLNSISKRLSLLSDNQLEKLRNLGNIRVYKTKKTNKRDN